MSPLTELITGAKAYGWGSFSLSSSFESIASVKLTSGTSTVTFSSIPTTYKHLQVRFTMRVNVNGISNFCILRVNNDSTTTNYAGHYFSGAPHVNSTYIDVGQDVGNYSGYLFANHCAGNTNQSNYFSPTILEIYDYTNTNIYKTMRSLTGFLSNAGSETSIRNVSGLYRSTSAITRLDFITAGGDNMMTNTTISLYGMRA